MSHYVFVESNTTGTGRIAVESLLAAGERVSFITAQPGRYPFLSSDAPNLNVIACDTSDADAIEASARALAVGAPVHAVLTFSTFYVATAAHVATRLGLPTLDPDVAMTCHYKQRCRARLRDAGLPSPAYWVVASEAEAVAVSREVSYPCVAKPVAESGSNGVLLIDTPERLLAHYRALASRTTNERGQPLPREVLVESLLTGPEFSVETFTLAGVTHVIGVTQKSLSEPPYFVELGHMFPSDLAETERALVAQAAVDGIVAVGVDHGPAHTEVRLTPSGPVIVEINPRLAGGMIPELVRRASGIDLVRAVLEAARGGSVTFEATQAGVAGIRFLTAPIAGTLQAVRGLEHARALESVCEIRVDKQRGAAIGLARGALDRLGYIIAAGPDRARVQRDLSAAAAMIEIEITSS